jgi:hypothetical protein
LEFVVTRPLGINPDGFRPLAELLRSLHATNGGYDFAGGVMRGDIRYTYAFTAAPHVFFLLFLPHVDQVIQAANPYRFLPARPALIQRNGKAVSRIDEFQIAKNANPLTILLSFLEMPES